MLCSCDNDCPRPALLRGQVHRTEGTRGRGSEEEFQGRLFNRILVKNLEVYEYNHQENTGSRLKDLCLLQVNKVAVEEEYFGSGPCARYIFRIQQWAP